MIRIKSLAAIALFLTVTAVAQEREYTPYERERFELDKHFEATVLLADGTRFDVSEFHFDTGLYKHKVKTGESELGIMQPLSNIKRIVRSRKAGWVHLVYLNDSEMHTVLRYPETQRFAGTKEDGTKWTGTLDEIAEIDVREVAAPEGK